MGNKLRNVLFYIMTKRQKMSFGNDVAQNGCFVWLLLKAEVAFGLCWCLFR